MSIDTRHACNKVNLDMMLEDIRSESNFIDIIDLLKRDENIIEGNELDIILELEKKLRKKSDKNRKHLVRLAKKKVKKTNTLLELLSLEKADHQNAQKEIRSQILYILASANYSQKLNSIWGIKMSKIAQN